MWLNNGLKNEFVMSSISQDFIKKLQKERTDYNHASQVRMQAKSLLQLSVGIYTEPERFVYELLQNAVDAFADTEGETLNIRIKVENDRFVFMHNGKPFDSKDVEGICDVGNGTKSKDCKKIGYKGIGFKSVFMPSVNHVAIISGHFCFEFDKQKALDLMPKFPSGEGTLDPDDVPWQVIPIYAPQLQNLSNSEFNVVTIVYTEEANVIATRIESLFSDLRFLLFLSGNNVKINFERDGQHVFTVGKEQHVGSNSTIQEVTLYKDGNPQSSWMLFSKDVPVPAEIKTTIERDFNTPDKLKGAEKVEISFAVQINGEKVIPLKNTSVFTFLPTSYRALHQPFLINSNFITDAGRQQLHQESEWNKLIFGKIPELYLNFVSKFSSKYTNYTEVLPTIYPDNDTLVSVYRRALQDALDNVAFIPNRNGNRLLKLGEVIVDRTGLSLSVFPIKRLLLYLNSINTKQFSIDSFVDNDMIANYVHDKVTIVNSKDLINILCEPNIIDNLSASDDIELIKYLHNYCNNLNDPFEKSSFEEELKHCPFLKDENDNWDCPLNIYLPSDFKESNNQAESVKFINKTVLDSIKENVNTYSWLKDNMGIKELDNTEFVKYIFDHPEFVTIDNAIDVGAFLFNVWLNFPKLIEDNPNNGTFKLLTKSGTLKTASELFLSEDYDPKIKLDKLVDDDMLPSLDYRKFGDFFKVKMFLLVIGANEDIALKELSLDVSNISDRFDSAFFTKVVETSKKWGNTAYVGFKINGQYPFWPRNINFYSYPLLEYSKSHSLSKVLFNRILSRPIHTMNDEDVHDVIVNGSCGFWSFSKNLDFLAQADAECPINYLEWVIANCPVLPTSLGDCRIANEIFAYSESAYFIAGKYLPVLDANEIIIHDSWRQKLPLKQALSTQDLLTVLEKISEDKESDNEDLFERVSAIYRELIDRGLQCSSVLKTWANGHKLLSKSGEFFPPSDLTFITVDGFKSKQKVYCEKIGRDVRDKLMQLLKTFGVQVITPNDITTDFTNPVEDDELRTCLLNKLQYFATLQDNDNSNFEDKKGTLKAKILSTRFYKCDNILLAYGDANDSISKSTFYSGSDFYYTGKVSPAHLEPLLSPLCTHLNLGSSNGSKMMVILITDDHQSLVDYLADCGCDVSNLVPFESSTDTQELNLSFEDGTVINRGNVDPDNQREINKAARIHVKPYLAAHGYDVSMWNPETSSSDLIGVIKDPQGSPINVVIRSAKRHYIHLSASSFETLMSNPNNLLIVESYMGNIQSVTFEELFGNDSNVNLIFDARYTSIEYFKALGTIFKYVKNTDFVVKNPNYSTNDEIRGFGLDVKNEGTIIPVNTEEI